MRKFSNEGDRNMLPQNMSPWRIDYFELKAMEDQLMYKGAF